MPNLRIINSQLKAIKKGLYFAIILIFLFINSSCSSKHESPVIYLSNASSKPIKNIVCNWAENDTLSLSNLTPGESRSQPFYLRNNNKFFGLVKISWLNNKDEKIEKEFFFKKKNMPSINDYTTYNYVQLYFDQNDLEVVSSDAPDLSGKTSKMDQVLLFYKEQYLRGHENEQNNELITIKPKKDTSVPAWLNIMY